MLFSLKNLAKSSSHRTKSLGILTGIDSTSIPFTTTAATTTTTTCLIPAKDIVLSFKQWFKSGNRLLLHQIFQILKATSDSDHFNHHHQLSSADLALSHLDLHLSEALVLEVLRYGHEHEHDVLSCLKFFDWVGRQNRFYHTRATFNAIFKILSRAKLMSLMLDFLANFRRHKFDDHGVRFHDTLVMGYAVSGKPEVALQLFGRMRFQGLDLDAFGYHVLLNALVEEKCFDAVEVVANQISMRGFENEITHSVMLKWFCKRNLLDEAEGYLRRLVTEGKANGSAVGVLVRALCQHKMFERAIKLMDEFRDLGVVSMESAYAVWIGDLAQAGRLDQALEFLQSKKSLEGYVPDVFRYNILIGKLLREVRLEEVCDLMLEMKEREISPDTVTMNAALCFFCKVGMLDIAIELYDSRSEFGLTPNSMSYNYLINTFCGDGSVDEAYGVLKSSLDQGYFPGRKTFSILADALCREGKLDKMKELVIFALERNLMPSGSTYDKFITTLCKTRRVEDGYLIHEELNRISEVRRESTYINLIEGFCKLNKGDIAARLLIEMQVHGHSPTHKLFRDVICSLCDTGNPVNTDQQFFTLLEMQLSCREPTCRIYNFFIYGAGHAKRPDLASKVLEMMQRSGIEPNLSSDVLMLQSYLKSERYSDALNYFNDLRHRRKIRRRLYSAMITGMCKAKKADIALNLLREMRENGMVPSDDCYEFLIQLLCWNKEYDIAVILIKDLEKVGRHITSFIGNILLLHSLKSQELYQAWVRLREVQIEISDNSILGLLIGAFSGRIWVSQQIENLEEVIASCFPLDVYTYNLLLRCFSNSNMDHACALFYRMSQKGYEPNRWTYEILVQGFLKHGRTDEANRWLKAMYVKGFSPNKQTMGFD
ncbi:pentatricopeptide repeat-containing protein At1g71210, mitochondrial [Rosa rugosa]|uniref:pentatricopeptide repeat-containing protein At1g71210, mitochondrial n=1 Tax=Rosa rugosa TaxID=74645 RepID=UPI002B40D926|nr:pentatricopeptide repeat-containing protein At1g71210, mitochondrial [Rosa rugosa]XP_062018447.1 pentatricopeptide repeat-containing protein At1g71210, mitochondrial [Rosa rugosa]